MRLAVQTTTICLVNRNVSRVLLQNSTFLTGIRAGYSHQVSGGDVAMTKANYEAFVNVGVALAFWGRGKVPVGGGGGLCLASVSICLRQ